jgi:Protein of unknown function (DUF1257)
LSKYLELQTNITDERFLIEALQELGYRPDIFAEGRSLTGYRGDERQERAHVIIPRRQLNCASNDIGFVRDSSGVYRAVISEYDRGIGFDDGWLGRLAQIYKERQTMAIAKAKGYVFKGKEIIETPHGRKIQLRFAVRSGGVS